MVALKARGYAVPKGSSHHKRGIDSLRYTLGESWATMADFIERCSRLRGQAVYEAVNAVSEEDANDLLQAAKQLKTDVIRWLRENHAELVPPNMAPQAHRHPDGRLTSQPPATPPPPLTGRRNLFRLNRLASFHFFFPWLKECRG